eukprot:1031944-Alexandrium_andersonii.AAC.1
MRTAIYKDIGHTGYANVRQMRSQQWSRHQHFPDEPRGPTLCYRKTARYYTAGPQAAWAPGAVPGSGGGPAGPGQRGPSPVGSSGGAGCARVRAGPAGRHASRGNP